MRNLITILLALFLFTACTNPLIDPATPDSPVSSEPGNSGGNPGSKETPSYLPQPGDDKLSREVAYLDSSEILIMESYPVQVNLHLVGGLPTPCHKLRVAVAKPDTQNRINIDVYSVVDSSLICVQMIEGFDINVSLGSFPAGNYSVWVNDSMVGEFTS